MPKKSSKTNGKKEDANDDETWRYHDLYDQGCSANRITTRSQTGFHRIKCSESDLDLFSDPANYNQPGLPHLMVTMKGKYGAIPKTIITRSTAKELEVSKELCDKLDEYKKKSRKNSKSDRKQG